MQYFVYADNNTIEIEIEIERKCQITFWTQGDFSVVVLWYRTRTTSDGEAMPNVYTSNRSSPRYILHNACLLHNGSFFFGEKNYLAHI